MNDELWIKEGYYVWIGEPLGQFYKVGAREAFDFETGEEDTAIFSAVAAGGQSNFKNITILEPDEKPQHLFQVLWGVKDTLMKYYLKLPTGVDRHGIDDDKDIGFVDAYKSPAYNPNPEFMFWIIHDFYPAINAKNVSPFSQTPKIFFTGMKYDIEEVTDPAVLEMLRAGKIPCKRLYISGIKTSSGV